MVKEVDDWIGEILQKLDDLELTDNTLVIFTSDHGEMLGDHGMHSKMIFYEGSVHVPLLMRFPGRISAGTVVKESVSSLDVFPTILDYLGLGTHPSDGRSLRTFIAGDPEPHDVVSFSTGRSTPNYMIRSGDLKLMMADNAQSNSVDALYNLATDPLEMRNLILSPNSPETNREQAEMMKSKLVAWLRVHEPPKVAGVEERELY
jgi:arylsulfatase A-like enzyme